MPAARRKGSKRPPQTCPNCPGAAQREVFRSDSACVVECAHCGLQFAQDYPEITTEAQDIYSPEYFAAAIEAQKSREAIFEAMLRELEGVLGRRGRLLDIGAGEGTLLVAARRLGWTVEGTEIASPMVERARSTLGLTMHGGELESLDLPHQAYDAVVLNHVLEHVQDPGRTLRRVVQLLVPDGIVRIEVPNLAGLSSRWKNLQSRLHLKRAPWKHYSVNHHFWFFTPATLHQTLRSAGFVEVQMRAPAQQWGPKGPVVRRLDPYYQRWLLGGHLVAYARPGGNAGE